MLDGLVPLLVEEVEACCEGFGCCLVEVAFLLRVVTVRDERKSFGKVLVDGGIDLCHRVALVLRVQRLLGQRAVGYTEVGGAGRRIVVLAEEVD